MENKSFVTTGATRALLLLLAINLFNYLDRYILAAVEPLIAKEFFAENDPTAMARTGSLATAFLVSYMVLAPACGALADRMSRWVIIAFGVGVWSLASGWSGLAGTFAALIVSRIFAGVGEAAYGPAAPTIISDLYPVEKRERMLSYFYIAIPVGSALG
jgi:MFS family permease